MSDNPIQQSVDMMQEAIDGQLSEEKGRQLLELLERDSGAAQAFDRLRRVDNMLKRAPQQRAPARLAATIMARLAQRMESETELAQLPAETQKLVMLSLSGAMMAMMPMMEAASWLVLNARRDPELLGEVMLQTIGMMSLVTEALILLLENAEDQARTHPELATATLALTPYLLKSMLDHLDSTHKETRKARIV